MSHVHLFGVVAGYNNLNVAERGYGQGVRGSLIHTYSSLDTRDPGHNIDSTVSLTPTLQDPCEGTFSFPKDVH